jgi:conserved protein with predicted RNA binding PUA domain
MLKRARMIADLQFGKKAGATLFPDGTTFGLSNTGRLRYLFWKKERIATLRANDGLLTLSMLGAQRLHSFFPFPKLRVAASDDAAPFVAKGGNLFAKHVVVVDTEIRSGEEILATGTAVLAPEEMLQIRKGVAVLIRKGAED